MRELIELINEWADSLDELANAIRVTTMLTSDILDELEYQKINDDDK